MVMKAHGFTATAAACILGFSVGFVQAPEQRTDSKIRDAVEDELQRDHFVSLNSIDAQVDDGIVTLSGDSSNLLSQERAARIAERSRACGPSSTASGARATAFRASSRATTSRRRCDVGE